MRWLVIGLFVSVVALLVIAGIVARYVSKQRRINAESENLDEQKLQHVQLDKALDLRETDKANDSTVEQVP